MKRKRYLVPFLLLAILIEQQSRLVAAIRYIAPQDCDWKPNYRDNPDDVSLSCKLRTINGAFDTTNLSLIQSQHTKSLSLFCDDILFESSLTNRSFEHLKELQELRIERCKIRDLPSLSFSGLNQLINLTLKTFNVDWGDFSLTIAVQTLAWLKQLERVDLSKNNMVSLPDSLFCNLSKLKFLNLSSNQFVEVVNVGFSTKKREQDKEQINKSTIVNNKQWCQLDSLAHLDVSLNKIKVLTDRGFSLLSRLKTLVLHHNQIARAEETSLLGLNELTYLDLSNNELVALPPRFFQPVHQALTELHLQNNSITVLPPGLFNGLQQLMLLDLSHNEITSHWIGLDTFSDLIRVSSLDLSFNRLSRIDASTFRSQYHLQMLHLHHNEIESIAENAFASLYNLHTLVLSHNRISRIDSMSLTGLHVLTTLSVDNNKIDFIHQDAFGNTSNLMELSVSANKFDSVPAAISSLESLRSLDLSYNSIVSIGNASYQGNEHLYSLNLEGNHIGNLSKGVFLDLPSLRILNLAKNRIQAIEQQTFDDVPDLHALRLDSNSIVDINGLFSNLRDLLMLNISANRISWFDYALIPIGLQWLDIHDNRIDNLGNYFELESLLKLRTLDCSFNKIAEIDSSSLPDGIEIVFLNNNSISKIAPFTFMGKQNLTRVDLTNNRLQTLDINAFRLSKVRVTKPLPAFNVSGNPYLCDCNMEWLQRIGTLNESRQYPQMVDVDRIICQLSFTKHKSAVPLKKADSSQFLCPYKSHCFALCHCCEFDACDCEMTCPDNCTCYSDQSWNTNIVDCSASWHTSVPQRIPMDATELYLDGNDVPTLSSHTFIGRKNMKILHLNHSRIVTINNRTFNGLKSLQILNLNYNHLSVLHGYEFERLVDLKELYLSYNRITTVANTTFTALKMLQKLHLDHNFIVEFQVWNLNLNSYLAEARISHNMWSCECSFVEQLVEWLPSKTDIIVDAQDVQCYFNETTGLPIVVDFNISACTNFSVKNIFAQRFQVQDFVPIFLVTGSFLVIILLVLIVILIYRREMSVWFYSRYGVRLQGRAASRREEEKLFDAFVSYSKKDEAFVSQILAPELEYGNPPFRLCLHYRDLPVASGYLSDAIVEAMNASRRTLIVISENFLKGEWCRYEFKSAHLEVLRTSTSSQRIILIFMGKINSKDLDPDIRFWLKTNTFLHWGEKLFWEKLRYAMPDIAYTRKPTTAEQTRDLTVAIHI